MDVNDIRAQLAALSKQLETAEAAPAPATDGPVAVLVVNGKPFEFQRGEGADAVVGTATHRLYGSMVNKAFNLKTVFDGLNPAGKAAMTAYWKLCANSDGLFRTERAFYSFINDFANAGWKVKSIGTHIRSDRAKTRTIRKYTA